MITTHLRNLFFCSKCALICNVFQDITSSLAFTENKQLCFNMILHFFYVNVP